MSKNNYELFNEIAGQVLAHLLERFPIESSEPVGKITGYVKCGGEPPHEWEIFNRTVEWLEAEGFIRFKSRYTHKYTLPNAVLSLKGLEALKSLPDPINPNSGNNLAESIMDAAQEGAKEKIIEVTKKGMSALFIALSDQITV